jgi:hypothetical protein
VSTRPLPPGGFLTGRAGCGGRAVPGSRPTAPRPWSRPHSQSPRRPSRPPVARAALLAELLGDVLALAAVPDMAPAGSRRDRHCRVPLIRLRCRSQPLRRQGLIGVPGACAALARACAVPADHELGRLRTGPMITCRGRERDHSKVRTHPTATDSSRTGLGQVGNGRPPSRNTRYLHQPDHLTDRRDRGNRRTAPRTPGRSEGQWSRAGNGAPTGVFMVRSTPRLWDHPETALVST